MYDEWPDPRLLRLELRRLPGPTPCSVAGLFLSSESDSASDPPSTERGGKERVMLGFSAMLFVYIINNVAPLTVKGVRVALHTDSMN